MKKIVLLSFLILLFGCGQKSLKPQLITTLFPAYSFSQAIAGDVVNVTLLLPPGSDAHNYQPAPQDMVSLKKSVLFVHSGLNMEPWVAKILETSRLSNVVDTSEGVRWITKETDGHGDTDPHYWTDFDNAQIMANNILAGLIRAFPNKAEYFTKNAQVLNEELSQLHNDTQELLTPYKGKTIIMGGHNALGYFFEKYEIPVLSAYEGFSANSEPSPKKIAQLVQQLNNTKNATVFYEENIDPKIARVLSEQTGAQILLLHGTHNVSKQELTEKVSYISLMRNNLVMLKKGLKE